MHDAEIRRRSRTEYVATSSESTVVAIPEVFGASWGADPGATVALAAGTLGVEVEPGTTSVRFARWRAIRASYALTAALAVALFLTFLRQTRQ